MNLNIWAKTFFSIYRCLDRLATAADRYVKVNAYKSFGTTLNNISATRTEKLSDNIIKLMNKKITLINIKILTEQMLMALPKNQARLVIMKYIDNKSLEERAELFKTSVRTVMRWDNAIIEACASFLQENGYDGVKLVSILGNEKWILKVAEKIVREEQSNNICKIPTSAIIAIAMKEYHLLN